jgi:hypothetical protein
MKMGYGRLTALTALLMGAAWAFQQTAWPARPGMQEAIRSGTSAGEVNQFAELHDLAFLWTKTDNSHIYGFIGPDYLRLRIHFSSVKKDPRDPTRYLVRGKTLVNNDIADFDGAIVVKALRNLAPPYEERGDFDKENGFVEKEILAKYVFRERPQQKEAGTFEGSLTTLIYTDRSGGVHYDDIDSSFDGYSNNEFTGTWKSYRGNTVKKCNWGDYRIPDSGDLDVGAGEFYPNEKYIDKGWQAFTLTDEEREKAETRAWWR